MDNKSIDKKPKYNDFQEQVSQFLVRHRSLLDIMTKMQEYNARINRAVVKSVTNCGCISIDAKKQDFSVESYGDLAQHMDNHLHGEICDNCREVIGEEIGNHLFYLAALCNTLDLDLMEILNKEYDKNNTLGIYSLR